MVDVVCRHPHYGISVEKPQINSGIPLSGSADEITAALFKKPGVVFDDSPGQAGRICSER
jgi:hypothetical protein